MASVLFPKGSKQETFPTGFEVVRIHQTTHGAVWFSPAKGAPPAYRFDAPAGQYGVMYAALTIDGAFVETVLRKSAGRILHRAYVEQRSWTTLKLRRPLSLAKLHGDGLLWHGTDASIGSADDYAQSRQMALDLYREFESLDGIVWRARHDNGEMCYALFDRVSPTDLQATSTRHFKDNWSEVERLMEKYGAHFDTSAAVPPP